jgi:hypothetical protein
MTPFEFICAFYSVVLGVAVAQLMTGVGRLAEERDRVRGYWVSNVWIVTVLMCDVTNWWGMWGLHDAKRWSIYSFLLLVALSGTVYLTTVLLFPRIPASEEAVIDMEQHYYKSGPIFFPAMAAAWVLAFVCNWSFFPITWLSPGNVFPVFMIILCAIAAVTANRRYHAVFAIIGLLVVIVNVLSEGVWTLETFIE